MSTPNPLTGRERSSLAFALRCGLRRGRTLEQARAALLPAWGHRPEVEAEIAEAYARPSLERAPQRPSGGGNGSNALSKAHGPQRRAGRRSDRRSAREDLSRYEGRQ